MKINTVSYWITDAVSSINKNRKNFLISTGTMLITMLIVAITYSISCNAANIAQEQEKAQSKISFYLEPSITDEQIKELQNTFDEIPEVTSIEYVSSEEGIAMATEVTPALTEGFDPEVLTSFFPSYFKIGFAAIGADDIIIEKVMQYDNGIQDYVVSESAEQAIRKAKVTEILSTTFLMIVVELSVLLIMNATKLMLYAQRKEISIMKYVGATNKFIRMPFIIQGVITALIAVALTMLLVFLLYNPITEALGEGMTYSLLEKEIVLSQLWKIILPIGIGIGIIGSSVSMNKYLDV